MSPLRRTGDWPRKKPLRSSKPLVPGSPVRSTPLSRRSGMPEVSSGSPVAGQPLRPSRPKVNDGASSLVADVSRVKSPRPKRPKVTAEEKRARDLVYARSGWVCEGCGQARAAEWAHRVKRSVGPWCPANGLHLCNDLTARPGRRGCHEWSHGKDRREAEALGWILHTSRDYLTTPVQHAAHGLVLLLPDGSVTPTERTAA